MGFYHFYGSYLRAILQKILKNSIHNINVKITFWKLLPFLPWATELNARIPAISRCAFHQIMLSCYIITGRKSHHTKHPLVQLRNWLDSEHMSTDVIRTYDPLRANNATDFPAWKKWKTNLVHSTCRAHQIFTNHNKVARNFRMFSFWPMKNKKRARNCFNDTNNKLLGYSSSNDGTDQQLSVRLRYCHGSCTGLTGDTILNHWHNLYHVSGLTNLSSQGTKSIPRGFQFNTATRLKRSRTDTDQPLTVLLQFLHQLETQHII